MILIIPPSNFDFLKGMPDWFVWAFVVVYGTAFAGMLGSIAYVIYSIV